MGQFEVVGRALLVLVWCLLWVAQASSFDMSTKNFDSASATIFGKASPPVGYVQFCARGEGECNTADGQIERFAMSGEKWDMLNQVNTYVNGKVIPSSDMDLYHVAELWAYPVDAVDCEDYVLLKKRYLVSAGFNADE